MVRKTGGLQGWRRYFLDPTTYLPGGLGGDKGTGKVGKTAKTFSAWTYLQANELFIDDLVAKGINPI